MALKKEIIRLGIQDKPTIGEYRKKFDKNVAPSATTLMYKTGKTWLELLEEIGLDYKTPVNKYADNFNDKEKIISDVIELMHERNILNSKEVREKIFPELGVPYSAMIYGGIDWRKISSEYEKIRRKR